MRELFILLFGIILGVCFDRVAGDFVDEQIVKGSAAVEAYRSAE